MPGLRNIYVERSASSKSGCPRSDGAAPNTFTVEFLSAKLNVLTIGGVTDKGFGGPQAAPITYANGSPAAGAFLGGQFVAPINPYIQTVSWQPTQSQWAAIAAASPDYWVVVSRDYAQYFPPENDIPTPPPGYADSGDYSSGPQPITIRRGAAGRQCRNLHRARRFGLDHHAVRNNTEHCGQL